MIGITLVEDLAVVVLTILMPVLVNLNPHHLLGVAKAIGMAALILMPIGFLILLATCLGTAALAEAVGLFSRTRGSRRGTNGERLSVRRSRACSDAAAAQRVRRLVLCDGWVLINPRNVLDSPGFLLAILLLVIVGKFIVWTVVVKLF